MENNEGYDGGQKRDRILYYVNKRTDARDPRYIIMYCNTYSKSMDQPGKVANPARGQLKRKTKHFPVRVRA